MKINLFKLSLFILFLSVQQFAQLIPFDSEKWIIEASESKIETHLGRQSLMLRGGSAYIKDSDFLNGIIEFDISCTGERGFMGVIWRIQDNANFEEFYIRPHLPGKPDANQYNPVFNGIAGWQLYFGEDYSTPVVYKNNTWIHIKVIVNDKNAEVYISDMNEPVLFIKELKRIPQSGMIGLHNGNYAAAHYSNFSYQSIDNPVLKGKPGVSKNAPAGTVMSWLVSNPFDEKSLENKFTLTENELKNLTWEKLPGEKSGVANLARLHGITETENTVFAKIIINSDIEQIKTLKFGYSDRVKVYINGKLCYGGNNNYMSRDYRYLGTIGYFDEVYVQLDKGYNEILFAVSEDFGGWGIQANFPDVKGITF